MSKLTDQDREFFQNCDMRIADIVMINMDGAAGCHSALKNWVTENPAAEPELIAEFNQAIEILERTCQDELDPVKAARIAELTAKMNALDEAIAFVCFISGGDAVKALPLMKQSNESNEEMLASGVLEGDNKELALRLQKDFSVAIEALEEIVQLMS